MPGYLPVLLLCLSLTPAERTMRAKIAANDRWSRLNAAERLIETKPGRDALEKLIDEFDPDRVLSEEERLKLLECPDGPDGQDPAGRVEGKEPPASRCR